MVVAAVYVRVLWALLGALRNENISCDIRHGGMKVLPLARSVTQPGSPCVAPSLTLSWPRTIVPLSGAMKTDELSAAAARMDRGDIQVL